MSETKHKWEVKKRKSDVWIADEHGNVICQFQAQLVKYAEGEKNAKLIASAPELLEALIWANERIDNKAGHQANEEHSEYNLRMFAFMKSTINKATK